MKTKNNPTLKDIASHTGVSITAVSHVLNNRLGRVRVSDKMQDRIRKAADALNYVPQLKARSMATNKSYAIAALYSIKPVVGDLGNAAYFIHALCGVEEVCKSVNYHCMFATCDLESPKNFVKPRLMQDGSVDGVILIGYTSNEVARQLTSLNLPCVHMGSNLDPNINMPHIDPDMDTAIAQTVDRLYELGHRNIELFMPQGPGPEAVGKKFSSLGQKYPDLKTICVFSHRRGSFAEDIHEHAQRHVADPNRPTAYLCHSPHATGLFHVFSEAGLSSPRDYSLVTFGPADLVITGIGPVGQKAALIEIPAKQTAQYATSCLLETLKVTSDTLPNWQQKVPCPFHVGPTLGPAPRL